VLLVHGVTSASNTFWRVGPALAATGRAITAVDLPGHGRTGGWRGRHRFGDTAVDLAAFIRTAGLDGGDLVVLGHSWGALVGAHLPLAGVRPLKLVLLDPPALTLDELRALADDATEQSYDDLGMAREVVRAANPTWPAGEVEVKAENLTLVDSEAVRAVYLENGAWDAGLTALDAPDASGLDVWVIRGDPAAGGMIADEVVPRLASRVGQDHVLTIAGAPHSPQRTHPEATVLAILMALDG
jgi:pimeloyl-ACP methyl ester carboxylesterase